MTRKEVNKLTTKIVVAILKANNNAMSKDEHIKFATNAYQEVRDKITSLPVSNTDQ